MTSRLLPRICSAVAVFCTLALVGFAHAQSIDQVKAKSAEIHDAKALAQYLRSSKAAERNPELRSIIGHLENAKQPKDQAFAVSRAQGTINLLALRNAPVVSAGAKTTAQQIKLAGNFRDPGVSESSNWLGRALARLKSLFHLPQMAPNNLSSGGLGQAVTWAMWFLLLAAIGVFVFLAVRHYGWRARLARQAMAVLEEDEPERSADEWLTMADQFESQGDFRRAVRCLYLACLLRFDEAQIARFDRGQTNWEHLARIQASPRRPADLDFRPPTKAFDIIWYGHIVRGAQDVETFRSFYGDLKLGLAEVPA